MGLFFTFCVFAVIVAAIFVKLDKKGRWMR